MATVAEIVRWIAGVTAVVNGTPRTAESVNAGLRDLANRSRWLKDRFYDLLLGAPLTVSAVNTTTDRLTITSHGIPANSPVQVFAANGGSLPGGLAPSVVYYVGVVDADTIYLSATIGPGAAVDLSAGFSGDVYVQIVQDWMSVLLIADSTWGYGKLTSLVCFLAGSQAVTGTKTFTNAKMAGTARWGLTSRNPARVQAGFWYDNAYSAFSLDGFEVVPAGSWSKVLTLPNGSTLTAVSVRIDPGANASLPQNLPTISVYKVPATTGIPAIINTGGVAFADPTTPAASYRAEHSFSAPVDNEVINNTTHWYFATFVHESGTNAVNGSLNSMSWGATVTEQDDAAS